MLILIRMINGTEEPVGKSVNGQTLFEPLVRYFRLHNVFISVCIVIAILSFGIGYLLGSAWTIRFHQQTSFQNTPALTLKQAPNSLFPTGRGMIWAPSVPANAYP